MDDAEVRAQVVAAFNAVLNDWSENESTAVTHQRLVAELAVRNVPAGLVEADFVDELVEAVQDRTPIFWENDPRVQDS